MIGERLKEAHYKQNLLSGYKKREKQERLKRALEHYDQIIGADHDKRSKIFELEKTDEGYTRIRKIRL